MPRIHLDYTKTRTECGLMLAIVEWHSDISFRVDFDYCGSCLIGRRKTLRRKRQERQDQIDLLQKCYDIESQQLRDVKVAIDNKERKKRDDESQGG